MQTTQSTKETIIQSAKKLFTSQSFAAVSMSDIAKDVGISKASLYHFFENKREIYSVVVEELVTTIQQVFQKATKDPSQTSFAKTIERVIIMSLEEGNIIMRLDAECIEHDKSQGQSLLIQLQNFFVDVEKYLDSQGVTSPALATHVLLSSVHAYVKWAQIQSPDTTPKEYSEYIQTLFLPNNK